MTHLIQHQQTRLEEDVVSQGERFEIRTSRNAVAGNAVDDAVGALALRRGGGVLSLGRS
jgi:hypothetical protein